MVNNSNQLHLDNSHDVHVQESVRKNNEEHDQENLADRIEEHKDHMDHSPGMDASPTALNSKK